MDLPINYEEATWQERRKAREEYIKQQRARCFWCGSLLTGDPSHLVTKKVIDLSLFPKGFFNHPIHLQHCHDTGMTEGAVHAYCNAVMWQYHRR